MPQAFPFDHPNASRRLRAALDAGTAADAEAVPALIARSGVEPDFFVRDMLTWAITRMPSEVVVPLLVQELTNDQPSARSQALHTLSKIGRDRLAGYEVWPRIFASLADSDDEVARSAWRSAVLIVPDHARVDTATALVRQLGRGDDEVRLSLSRALIALGDDGFAAIAAATPLADQSAREHAANTLRLAVDSDSGLDSALHAARRAYAIGGA